ncbi:uncharacterized protein N7483_007482 [Penicillium malachiteum]|uniref:uncharacterized protein n=1 Tax=Penicillium malachiteum TaxID=1324776 RepID=UPI0025473197|nr:uncharacterized protein N7483_007482 [Penicillium malachiteum]KAJ5726125.1 hypothetical protein N7483_007482 [Penicillium malachiteum]
MNTKDRVGKRNGTNKKFKGRNGTSVSPNELESEDWGDWGSPWDPTPRKPLKIEDMDLEKSYVKEVKEFEKIVENELELEEDESEQPQRRPRWKHQGKEPLTDISKLIEMEWDAREPDLDPADLKAQIDRCKERIDDNIVPSFFEDRLKLLEAENSEILEIQKSEKGVHGLSMDVLTRIAQLRETKAALENNGGGSTNQLPNVDAILAAYRNKSLDWTGLVTYWSEGKQLCQPRLFDWDEFEAINDTYNGSKSFWVEGFSDLSPRLAYANRRIPALRRRALAYGTVENVLHFYTLALRIPGRNWWTDLEFLYDTGASDLLLFRADIDLIAGPIRNPALRIIEENTVYGIIGDMTTPVVELEVTILDTRGRRIGPWIRVPGRIDERAGVNGRTPGTRGNPRLDGGVLRQFFYYMTSPDNDITLTIAKSRLGMFPLAGGLGEQERLDLIENTRQYEPIVPAREYALGRLDADGVREILQTRRDFPRAA